MDNRKYRPCVVGVFKNSEDKLLVGKRSEKDIEKGNFQFPQGGVEKGESNEEALYREMLEEVGCDNFSIKNRLDGPICYDFPESLDSKIAKIYKGQDLYWFLCEFDKDSEPDLKKASSNEFSKLEWHVAEQIIKNIIDWKKNAYEKALGKLNLISK